MLLKCNSDFKDSSFHELWSVICSVTKETRSSHIESSGLAKHFSPINARFNSVTYLRMEPRDEIVMQARLIQFVWLEQEQDPFQFINHPFFDRHLLVRNAGAVIHSHSKHAVLATLITKGKEFTTTHLEMIKVMPLMLFG